MCILSAIACSPHCHDFKLGGNDDDEEMVRSMYKVPMPDAGFTAWLREVCEMGIWDSSERVLDAVGLPRGNEMHQYLNKRREK